MNFWVTQKQEMAMFSYLTEFRRRWRLHANDEDHQFSYRCLATNTWVSMAEKTLGSATSSMVGNKTGREIVLSSHRFMPTIVHIVNMVTDKSVGRIETNKFGQLILFDDRRGSLREMPDEWKVGTTMIIGISGFGTYNLLNILGCDEDIIRFKVGQEKWHIPSAYMTATIRYDDHTNAEIEAMNVKKRAKLPTTVTTVMTRLAIGRPTASLTEIGPNTPPVEPKMSTEMTPEVKSTAKMVLGDHDKSGPKVIEGIGDTATAITAPIVHPSVQTEAMVEPKIVRSALHFTGDIDSLPRCSTPPTPTQQSNLNRSYHSSSEENVSMPALRRRASKHHDADDDATE